MTADETKAAFWQGAFAGFCGFLALVQLALASQLHDVAAMYRDFGNVELPLLTRITTHATWLVGTPLLALAAVAALLVKRPRSFVPHVTVAVVLVVVVAVTYWYPRAPIRALAGNISAD